MPIWWRKNKTIGAKSFSDQGSGSVGEGGSIPDVATLNSLAVQLRQSRENTIQIQYEQERLLVTDQAPHERGRFPKTQLRRGLDFVLREFENVGDPVHYQPGDL
jgi:hypothetical protein